MLINIYDIGPNIMISFFNSKPIGMDSPDTTVMKLTKFRSLICFSVKMYCSLYDVYNHVCFDESAHWLLNANNDLKNYLCCTCLNISYILMASLDYISGLKC